MGMTIAQMRAVARSRLAERTYELCLAQDLVARAQDLQRELADLGITAATGVGGPRRSESEDGSSANADGGPRPPKKLGGITDPRVDEIHAELVEVFEKMQAESGTLGLRAEQSGAWGLWRDAHPPRPGVPADDPDDPRTISYGLCDAAALMARLGDFAVTWNGAPLGDGEWAWIESVAPGGDLKEIARAVVQMHEGVGTHAPKSLRSSSGTATGATG
ncbi:MAG: hypothetical protein CMH83_19410 [Nocardioides sp.]|nr:hypothetical protein [Nocardioides sp.]